MRLSAYNAAAFSCQWTTRQYRSNGRQEICKLMLSLLLCLCPYSKPNPWKEAELSLKKVTGRQRKETNVITGVLRPWDRPTEAKSPISNWREQDGVLPHPFHHEGGRGIALLKQGQHSRVLTRSLPWFLISWRPSVWWSWNHSGENITSRAPLPAARPRPPPRPKAISTGKPAAGWDSEVGECGQKHWQKMGGGQEDDTVHGARYWIVYINLFRSHYLLVMQCYRSQGNKKEHMLLLPFGACVSSLFCLSWKLEILNTLTHKCIKINEVFLVPRELEGTSVQLCFSPNNDELGTDKEGGAETGCSGKGPTVW